MLSAVCLSCPGSGLVPKLVTRLGFDKSGSIYNTFYEGNVHFGERILMYGSWAWYSFIIIPNKWPPLCRRKKAFPLGFSCFVGYCRAGLRTVGRCFVVYANPVSFKCLYNWHHVPGFLRVIGRMYSMICYCDSGQPIILGAWHFHWEPYWIILYASILYQKIVTQYVLLYAPSAHSPCTCVSFQLTAASMTSDAFV